MKKLTKNELHLLNNVLLEFDLHEGMGIGNALGVIYSKLNGLPLSKGMVEFMYKQKNSIIYHRRPSLEHREQIKALTMTIMREAQDETN